ncbi:histidine phosphatase family protein [Cytophagaceae bacterium DM2B3-1]|uniref:Histidine phosphatase family protein n=1 Tax=Xanthocytophaga flava TaxID=3048013 RepID=A0ABT7CPN7_9BACT|nr:histidine phosphatase family protein [Xanthocytophaga flavus]MDJ1495698.1 histidine phosphatase family protein [Xanthocytophaga flavus]
MKTIYLFRHGKSSWKDAQLSDFDRPLNKRGKQDVPFMGQLLLYMNVKPDLWVSSSAKRAWSTAKRVAAELKVGKENIIKMDRLYHAEPETLLQVIQGLSVTASSVILFGHNPGLTELATLLCDYEFTDIPTSGVVGIQFSNAANWADVNFHQGKMIFFESPKNNSSAPE